MMYTVLCDGRREFAGTLEECKEFVRQSRNRDNLYIMPY